jgi:hypothetical protein
MRYFYEYKYKKGNRMVGGHNLEKIEFYDNYIKLSGVDIIPTNYDYEEQYWGTLLDMNEIEYLKIEPMLENQELKKKYENAVADYETTMFEKEQLNSLVNSCQEKIRQLKKQVEENKDNYNCLLKQKEQFEYIMSKQVDYQGQQKEFIKWLENGIEKVKNTEFLDERIQRAGLIAYNRCLQKYKSIIGGNKDEKK